MCSASESQSQHQPAARLFARMQICTSLEPYLCTHVWHLLALGVTLASQYPIQVDASHLLRESLLELNWLTSASFWMLRPDDVQTNQNKRAQLHASPVQILFVSGQLSFLKTSIFARACFSMMCVSVAEQTRCGQRIYDDTNIKSTLGWNALRALMEAGAN